MTYVLLFLVAGCSPVLFQLGTDVSVERKAWEVNVTTSVNAHEARLKALEEKSPPAPPEEAPL